jgi:hypothetical protein
MLFYGPSLVIRRVPFSNLLSIEGRILMRSLTLLVISIIMLFPSMSTGNGTGSIGTGWNITLLDTAEPTDDTSRVFGEIEFQTGFGPTPCRNWLGVVMASDAKDFVGGGLRYYRGPDSSTVYWGLGVGAYSLSGTSSLVTRQTVFAGGELVLELHVGVGNEEDIPVTLFVGAFPSVAGDDGTMFRLGAKLKPPLWGGPTDTDEQN